MIKDMLRLETRHIRAFLALGGFSVLYILSLLRADAYYVDDWYRAMTGTASWELLGRPLMTAATVAVEDGMPLLDASPWIQIASVLVLSYCLVLWGKRYLPEAAWWQLAGVLSFAYLNLFFLENLSYKYDALGMALALGVPFAIFALPEGISLRRLAAISIAGVVAQLSLYQAAIGAYLGLMVLEWLIYTGDGRSLRDMGRRLAGRFGCLLAGAILYKVLVAGLLIPKAGTYSAGHTALANPLTAEGLAAIGNNLLQFGELLQDYGVTLGWLGALLVLTLLISMGVQLGIIWQGRQEGRAGKLLLSAIVVLAPFLLVFASIASLALLARPIFAPRTLLSFSIFTLYIGVMVYYLAKVRPVAYGVTALAMAAALSLSSGYGNLLACQQRLDYVIEGHVLRDIYELEAARGRKFAQITYTGSSPRSRQLELLSEKRPLYGRLVHTQDWWTAGLQLAELKLSPIEGVFRDKSWEYGQEHEPDRSNEYCHIYADGDLAIVEFKER